MNLQISEWALWKRLLLGAAWVVIIVPLMRFLMPVPGSASLTRDYTFAVIGTIAGALVTRRRLTRRRL